VDRLHIGIDENGLGARLGPLIVTAVAARSVGGALSESGPRHRQSHAHLLDDSKRLVSHQDVRLGEAWARAIVGPSAGTPEALLEQLSIAPIAVSMQPCPTHVKAQCWDTSEEQFTATESLVNEVLGCLSSLKQRGLAVSSLRSTWTCTRILNGELAEGRHRFIVDLHSMERLILELRRQFGTQVLATCGKVGAMADYLRFFGPLAGHLVTVVEQTKERSSYEFAQIGRITFEQDADAHHPLVMIASLVGKYVREIFMGRIARRYASGPDREHLPSGYHDSVTNQFVDATAVLRKSRRVPFDCFERRRNQ
jgi:ribonuclease HII